MQKTFTFSGNIRRNNGGQIVVDLCKSDPVHLQHSGTDMVQNRPTCRKTVDLCFDDLVGKAGNLAVSIHFEEHDLGAVPQNEAHTAETVKHNTSPIGAMEEAVITALEQLDGN